MSLAKRALRGTAWAYLSVISSKLIVFLVNAWLVRLLSPSDFGLRQLAMVVIGLFEATQSLGVNDALINKTGEEEKTADTVFILNVGIGALLSLSVAGLAMWIGPNLDHLEVLSRFLGESNLNDIQTAVGLMPILGSGFFILSLGQTHEALLRKKLDFKTRFWPELISAIIRSVVAIVLALKGYGVMSLVYSQLTGNVIQTVTNWIIVPWRPKLRYYPEVAKEVWRFGSGITLFNTLSVGFDKVDETVIGGALGSASLGFYGEANRLPQLLIIYLNSILTSVIFPTFSKIKDDIEAITRGYLFTTRYLTIIVTPLALGMVLIAPDFVSIYFGPGWEPVVVLLQVLSMSAFWLTLAWPAGDVFKALGKPGFLTVLMLIEAAVNVPLLLFGAYLDVRGVTGYPALGAATGSSLGYLFGSIIRLIVVARHLKITIWEVLKQFVHAFIAGTLMFVTVYLIRQPLLGMSPWLLMLISMIVGGVVYTGGLWFFGTNSIDMALKLVRDTLNDRGEE